MRTISAGTAMTKCSSKAEKNLKRRSCLTSSGTSTSLLSSGSSTCTSSARWPKSLSKGITCTSRTISSKGAKCNYFIYSVNNSPKSRGITRKTESPQRPLQLLLNHMTQMMSASCSKFQRKMNSLSITRARSGSHFHKSRKF